MAGSKSDYLENKVLDAVLNNTSLVVATPYVALYTVAPTDSTGGTEVTGGSYARVAGSFGAASGGSCSNDAAVAFAAPTADWGTVVAFAICDSSTSGNILYWGDLTASRTILNGDGAPSFAIGTLTITES
jgi:hypothetical protein